MSTVAQSRGSAAPSPQPTPGKQPGSSGRDPLFSNAKLILIVLVVVGHSWGPLFGESHSVRTLYQVLYAFHMPAFILLCGYFSKSFSGKPNQFRRLVTGVAAPYFIFALLYGMLRVWTQDEFNPSLLAPYYLLWFLAALFVWRITAPIWKMVRYPLVVAVVISIGASTMELPTELDLGRILQFLPFFVAGMLMRREHFEKLRTTAVRIVGPILCLGLVVLAYFKGKEIHIDWVYYMRGASQLDVSVFEGVLIKLVLFAATTILIGTFFAWVPQRESRLSHLGDLTMYPFLLHGFFIRAAEEGLGWYDIPFTDTPGGAVLITGLAVILAFALLSKPVRWLTSPAVDPKLNWLLKPPEPRQPTPAASPPTQATESEKQPA